MKKLLIAFILLSGAALAQTSTLTANLSWTPSTDNVAVTGYRVERCSGVGCSNFVLVGSPVGASYSDPGLSYSTSYSWRVRAIDGAGNLSLYSNTASVTTGAAPDATAPTAPGTLIVVVPPPAAQNAPLLRHSKIKK